VVGWVSAKRHQEVRTARVEAESPSTITCVLRRNWRTIRSEKTAHRLVVNCPVNPMNPVRFS
jgi:hypothetical protein